jgi:hypothetical protein
MVASLLKIACDDAANLCIVFNDKDRCHHSIEKYIRNPTKEKQPMTLVTWAD